MAAVTAAASFLVVELMMRMITSATGGVSNSNDGSVRGSGGGAQ